MPSRNEALRRIREEAADHPDGCECRTCLAAAGDEEARQTLLRELV